MLILLPVVYTTVIAVAMKDIEGDETTGRAQILQHRGLRRAYLRMLEAQRQSVTDSTMQAREYHRS